MDNFRKHNPSRKTPGALDGFKAGNSGRPINRSTDFNQPRRSNVNTFSGKEGFRPSTQPVLSTSGRQPSQRPEIERVDLKMPSRPKSRRKRSWKKIILRSVIILILVSILTGGFLFGKGYIKIRGILKGGGSAPALSANVDPTKLRGEGDGRVNLLLLGKGGPGHEAPDLTDTILIASIDPVNKNASILSIPRDFWVKTDRGQSKINAVYANAKSFVLNNNKKSKETSTRAEQAGMAAIESTVEEAMGIPIHYYAMVDFVAFQKAINTVGGINIYVDPNNSGGIVKERLWDELTRKTYTLDVKAGQNTFDGQRALMYARSRHASARGDFDRAERQRAIIIALKDKVLSAGTYSNPVKINELLNDFGDHVQSNLSSGELKRMYDISKSIPSSKINSVGLADPPNNYVITDNINGQSIVRPRSALFDYTEIQSYVRNTLKDGYIQNENASIAVYNGSGVTGLAAVKATELKSYGYLITTVANAPAATYDKTVLVDLTNGKKKYTKHYLEQRLKVTAVTTMPDTTISPAGAEFVIILGKNESTTR